LIQQPPQPVPDKELALLPQLLVVARRPSGHHALHRRAQAVGLLHPPPFLLDAASRGRAPSLQKGQDVPFLHEVALSHPHFLDAPCPGRRHRDVHLHRLEDRDAVAFTHIGPDRGRQLVHHARHGCRHRDQPFSPPARRWTDFSAPPPARPPAPPAPGRLAKSPWLRYCTHWSLAPRGRQRPRPRQEMRSLDFFPTHPRIPAALPVALH